jgi:hypothetical protein
MPALVVIFARVNAARLCLKPWNGINKKAGANAGPLQLPCKLDQ